MYDGLDEYYVTVSEKIQRKEKHTQEEIHRKLGAALHQHIVIPCETWFQIPFFIPHNYPTQPFHSLPSKASKEPELDPKAFDGLDKISARSAAEAAAPSKTEGASQESEVWWCVSFEVLTVLFVGKMNQYILGMQIFRLKA